MLLAKGYPDIGWNPIEGERYLSFLRFAVFVNGMTAFTIQFPFSCLLLRVHASTCREALEYLSVSEVVPETKDVRFYVRAKKWC